MHKSLKITPQLLNVIFGEDSTGDTPEERAKTSKQMFVRSQDQFTFDNELATGLRFNAIQALEAFGMEKLEELTWDGSAVIVNDRSEPARTIINARLDEDWTLEDLAREANLTDDQVRCAENIRTKTPVEVLVAICKALGIDPVAIGFKKQKVAT